MQFLAFFLFKFQLTAATRNFRFFLKADTGSLHLLHAGKCLNKFQASVHIYNTCKELQQAPYVFNKWVYYHLLMTM